MGTAFTPAKTSPASWDAFNDVEAFVDAVLAELAAMAGTRRLRSGPKPSTSTSCRCPATFMPVEALWRWLREDVTYHYWVICHQFIHLSR
jgi:hypothetical protein